MKRKHFILALAAMLLSFAPPIFAQTQKNVAKVGDTEYATLSAAITAAQPGQTITFIADINENVTLSKNVTIDGNGKTYTGTMTGNAALTVTVQNVNFVNGGFAKTTKSSTGVYTFQDCTFEDNGTIAYPLLFKGANTVNVDNCSVKNYKYSFLYISSSALKVNVKNVTVEDCPSYAVYFGSGVTYGATIEGLTVKNSNRGIHVNNSANRSLTIKNCTMENVTTAIDHTGGTSAITCTALGVNDFGGAAMSEYAKVVAAAQIGTKVYETLEAAAAVAQAGETVVLLQGTNAAVTLPAGVLLDKNDFVADNVVVTKPAVAKIGEQGYETFAAAIAAATAGDIITFVADINEAVTINKSITIDGAGKQYIGTMTVNKGLTVTVENVNFVNGGIDKPKAQKSTTGTYTIKNCTFVDEGKYAYPLRFYGAATLNVENCTVKNYLYSFLYINGSTLNLNINNVTVEDCPNYAVYFATGVNNATIEGLTVKNSNNGILVNNDAARTLTIKNCNFEGVNTAINHSSKDAKNVITAKVQGANDFGGAVLSQYAKCVLAEDATLAATTAGLNVTTNVEGKEVVYQGGKYTVAEKFYAAQVGEQKYETLAAAVEAAEAGTTVKLLNVVTASDIITINKAITLDGNGKTLISTAGRAINVDCEGNVGIKNLAINASGERAINVINKPAKVTIENVTATAANYTVNLAGSAANAVVTINNSDLTGLNVVNVAAPGAKVTVTGGTLTCNDQTDIESYAALAIATNASKATITATGVTFDIKGDSSKAGNGTTDGTITIDGVVVGQRVAMIQYANGTAYTFDNLAAAVAKAEAGETVVLLCDVTVAEKITIAKSITLDGNGKTLTYTGSGASARAIDVPAADGVKLEVTIKNLTVDCTSSYCQRGINYNEDGKLTLEGVTVKGKNVTYALNLPGSSVEAQVTINNSNLTANIALNVWGKNAKINATDSHFTSVDNNTAEGYSAIVLNNDGATAAEGAVVNITGGTITAKDENGNPSNAVRNSTTTGVINVSDATVVTGNYTRPVAIVTYGTDQFYSCATLQAAIDKAIATNGSVKLLANVEASEIITVNAPVVIDGNGKTVKSTATRAFNIETVGKVVISNLTVNAGERAFNIINQPATVELNGVTATASNNAVMIATSADAANVTINGCDFTGLAVVNVAGAKSNVAIKNSTITNVDANPAENYGAITVWSSAEEAEVNVENTTITVADDSKKAYVFPANATVAGVDKVGYIVATVGDAGYDTLEEAIKEVTAGGTIELVRNITASDIITINKAITLDGNGKTLTSTAGRAINVSGADGVTIKNLTINASGERAINVIQNATNVTIDNVTATAANYTVNVAASAPNAVVAINNSTLSGLCTVNVSAAGANVTVDNSTVNCNDNNTTAGEAYAALSLIKDAVGGSIIATNSTINVTDGSDSMKGRNGAENGTVTINGSTEGVDVMVAVITYEGSDYYHSFASLAKAVEFAKAGDVITLIRDVTGAGVVIDKDITIDFNGKTYTVNQTVGSTGTTTLGLQILKDNTVTLKNGTLTSTATVEGSKEVKMLVQNYANLTVDNMKLVDDTDHILYVLSNNSGEVNIVNGSVISSDAVALDACKYASYEAPTVTVAEGVTVNGNVEVSATLNMNGALNGAIVINGTDGTVNGAEGLTVTAMDGYKVDYKNGAYTIVEKHYVAQVGEDKYETFAAAVAEAPAGATVTLIDDATENATVVLTKNLTIDGAGKTFTGAIEFKKSNGYFTVKNVKFSGAGTRVYALKSQASVTSLTVENCEATGYTYGFLYANKAVANAIVNNVTVKDVTYGVHSAYGNKVTLNKFVAENVKYGVTVQNYSGRNVVLNNCSFTGSENPLYIWERNQTNKITFNFQGANEMGKTEFCTSAMAVVNAEATAGTKVCGTLAEAVEAANAGDAVTLLRNAQLSTFVTINKSITLNMGEYNITRDGGTALYVNGDAEVVINGTTGTVTGSQALFVNNGLVKVNGGHFYGTSSNAEAVYVKGNGEVEIYGGTFEGDTNAQYYYVLNKLDADRATSSITVYGGTFVGFNPADNAAEGKGTNFVAEGYVVDNVGGTYTVKVNPAYGKVAKVGEQMYGSLQAAIDAAKDGETVTLISNVQLTDEDIILVDGSMKTFCHVAKGKNITFDMNGKEITVSYNGGNYLLGVFLVDGGLTVTGYGKINIPQTDRQVAYMFLKRGAEGYLVVENGTFHAGNLEDSMIYTNATNVVTVKGGTFTIDEIGKRENGCPWIFNAKGANERCINVTGGTYNWDISNQYWVDEVNLADDKTVIKTEDGLWTVAEAEAAIDGRGYLTLAAAVEAAVEGDYVTLLKSVTGAGVVIDKDLTIDFGDKTYTFNQTVGSTGTTTLGLQILKDNTVTLKNGTLTSTKAVEGSKEVKMLIQNYANLTVDNMQLVDATDHILYVLSNNSGDVVIKGNTNITTDAVAFDACKYANYAIPTVTVETTGKITGNIEVTGGNLAIKSGIFTTPILPEWCAEYYVPVQNADGTYGVEKRYIDVVTIEDDGKVTKFVNEKEMTVGTLTYKRNFSKSGVGDWQGFYVPFEVPVSDLADLGYEVAYILDVHYEYDYDKFDIKGAPNTHIIKLNSGILRANHPYVIRPTKNADPKLNLVLQYTDATLFSTEENVIAVESSSTTHRFVFSGTYKTAKRAELNGSDDIPCYLINNDGEFQAIGTNVNIATFRVYLSIYKKDGSPVILDETAGSIKMRVIGEEDENGETVIYDVEMDGEQTSDYIYDLHGRRVMEPQKGGIYIVNGKKVVF